MVEKKHYCHSQGVEEVARILFDNVFAEAIVHSLPMVQYARESVGAQLERLWHIVMSILTD
jgi:hypothetical protein